MGLALIWSVAAAVLSSPVPVYELDANVGIHAIGEAAAYWENSGFSTREEAARPAFQDNFVAFKNVRENFGFHSESIWVRVNLSNPQVRRARWVLELADPLVDLFEIHIPDGFGNYEIRTGGDMLPFAHRELAYERFAFTLDFEPGETKAIYLFIQPGYSSVELTAYTPHALTEKVHREQLFSGIYFGMLLLAIIYNFFIFSSMRHTAFLDYVIYGLGLLGVMAVVDGYCAQFFLPGYPIVANRLTGVFTAWIGFGGCRFILSYLGAESLSPLLVRFLKLSVYTNATVMGIAAFTPTVVGVPLALVTALMTFPAVLWASIYLSSTRHPDAANFQLAWAFVAIGGAITILAHFGIFNLALPSIIPFKVASAANMVFLSLGLASHFGRIQQENAIQNEVLVKQEKLVQIGELMGDLSHELKNLNSASLSGMEVERDRISEVLSFFCDHDESWPDLAQALFEPAVGRSTISRRRERWAGWTASAEGAGGIFAEVRESLASVAIEDELIDKYMRSVQQFEPGEMVLLSHAIALSQRLCLMNTTANHANSLLTSVLNYSRESGGDDYCDFASVVESCHRLMHKKLELASIGFQFHALATGPVSAPASDLHQVVLNLLGNAYDALQGSPREEKAITVFLETLESGRVRVTVENNGPAIPARAADRIFERHFSTKGAKGSGIGLYVCRKLVEKNSGDISVQSNAVKTAFLVELPAA